MRDWLQARRRGRPAPQAAEIGLDVTRHRADPGLRGENVGGGRLPELCELVGYDPPARKSAQPRSQAKAGKFGSSGSARQTSDPAPENGSFDYVGIVMAKSAEGDAVAAFMGRREGIEVREQAAFWDIRARERLVIPYDEISEELGYEIDAYSIQHEMSTHYGRMVATDDALMLFSDPTEAMEHLLVSRFSRAGGRWLAALDRRPAGHRMIVRACPEPSAGVSTPPPTGSKPSLSWPSAIPAVNPPSASSWPSPMHAARCVPAPPCSREPGPRSPPTI